MRSDQLSGKLFNAKFFYGNVTVDSFLQPNVTSIYAIASVYDWIGYPVADEVLPRSMAVQAARLGRLASSTSALFVCDVQVKLGINARCYSARARGGVGYTTY